MTRLLAVLILVTFTHIAVAQGPLVSSDERELSRAEVFSALDRKKFSELAPMSLDKLWKVMRRGRPITGTKTGFRKTLKTTDKFGRKTNVLIEVPRNPNGILVVLHGLGGDRFHLGMGTFDQFARDNHLILVAPDARKEPKGAHNDDLEKLSGLLEHWWSYRPEGFVISLINELKRTYRLDENRVYLSGHSMGAFGTWNLGLRFPDRFAALVPFAGGLSRREYISSKPDNFVRALLFNAWNSNILFIHGSADRIVPVRHSRRTRDGLKKFGYNFDYVELKGGRHMLDMRERSELMQGVGKWLRTKRRNAHPKRVRHRAHGAYMLQSFWLRIDDADYPMVEVDAEIVTGNKIKVSTNKAKKITLFIDETYLDPNQPIEVVVNGKSVFKKTVKLSRVTLIESWIAREDRHLLYRGKISLDLVKLGVAKGVSSKK